MHKIKVRLIKNILKRRQGVDEAITAEVISRLVQMKSRSVRTAIKHLIEVQNIPIAATSTSPYGYFIPSTKKEAQVYCAILGARINSINNRLKAFNKLAGRKFVDKMQAEQISVFNT